MKFEPGDIVACSSSLFWQEGIVKRSRFIVLDVFENEGCSSHTDLEVDCYLDVNNYIRVYCYGLEDEDGSIGTIFNLPWAYMAKLE